LEFWSIEAIKQCVISGLGVSFLPRVTVRSELEEGKLVKLNWNDESQRVATQLALHRKKWRSPALEQFVLMVREQAERWRKEAAM
jgi:DNA-binding transcriptional LysR family regulator